MLAASLLGALDYALGWLVPPVGGWILAFVMGWFLRMVRQGDQKQRQQSRGDRIFDVFFHAFSVAPVLLIMYRFATELAGHHPDVRQLLNVLDMDLLAVGWAAGWAASFFLGIGIGKVLQNWVAVALGQIGRA